MTAHKAENATGRQIDLDEVAKLIEALERDLSKVHGDSRDIQHLKDEVEALKNVLNSPGSQHHGVTAALHGIRKRIDGALDAAMAEGIEVGRYIAEIGRMIGM